MSKSLLGLVSAEECAFLRSVSRGVVVEVGSLGGLSASCFADGGAEEIHCFDTFRLFEPNVAYARMLGLPPDFVGSFLPVFLRNTEAFRDRLVVHECDALAGGWDRPIDVLFVDCSVGTAFQLGLVEKFYRHLVPGGLLIHQDFFYNRSPCLAPLMARLSGAFEIVKNVDTSMVYRRGVGEIPGSVTLDIGVELPREIGRFGGLDAVAGAVLATALVYWLRGEGRLMEADELTLDIIHAQGGRRVWENLREAHQ